MVGRGAGVAPCTAPVKLTLGRPLREQAADEVLITSTGLKIEPAAPKLFDATSLSWAAEQVGARPAWVVDVVVDDEVLVVVDDVGGSVVVAGVVVVVVDGVAVLVQAATRTAKLRIVAKPLAAMDFERRISILAIGTALLSAIRDGPSDTRPHSSMTATDPRLASIARHISETRPLVGIVLPECRQSCDQGSSPHDAQHAARDYGSAQPCKGLDETGLDVAECGP